MAAILGLITVNGKDVLEVDVAPGGGAGTAAPRGSLAMFDSGTAGFLYIKTGTADTAWTAVDIPGVNDWSLSGNGLTGGSPATPNEKFGSTNDYDVKFVRNDIEQMRLINGALLIGLNASLGGKLQVGSTALGDEVFKMASPNGGSGDMVIKVSRQYKVFTTNNTPTILSTLAVPVSSRILATFEVGGSQTGGASGAVGDGASYIRTIDTKRLAAGNALLQKYQTDFTSEDIGGFNVSAAAVGNNIELSVLGGTDKNISWFCHAEMLMIGV